MARSLDPGFVVDGGDDDRWPADAGWPYPDADELAGDLHDPADPSALADDDLLAIAGLGPHLVDGLTELEAAIITGRFGLDGRPPRSMKELQHELGVDRAGLRLGLADGLEKVRQHLRA